MIDNDEKKNIHIHVCVRLRPLIQEDYKLSANKTCPELCVHLHNDGQTIKIIKDRFNTKLMRVDHTFNSLSTQLDVYRSSFKYLVNEVINGFNATGLVYGQTGSGKTYTMFGMNNEPGIVQLAINDIFQNVRKYMLKDLVANVYLSFYQLYLEQAYDLLATASSTSVFEHQKKASKLTIREDVSKGVYVDSLNQIYVEDENACIALIKHGLESRYVHSTQYNMKSSRSHSIFQIYLDLEEEGLERNNQSNPINNVSEEKKVVIRRRILTFVDLAGSERVNIYHSKSKKQHQEAVIINKSISCLGNCIQALAQISNQNTTTTTVTNSMNNYKRMNHTSHIPFRDCKLTWLLAEPLGGNSKTCIIVNIGPCYYNYEETKSALEFALRARSIKKLVKKTDMELLRYREIRSLETYEQKERLRIIQSNEKMFGGTLNANIRYSKIVIRNEEVDNNNNSDNNIINDDNDEDYDEHNYSNESKLQNHDSRDIMSNNSFDESTHNINIHDIFQGNPILDNNQMKYNLNDFMKSCHNNNSIGVVSPRIRNFSLDHVSISEEKIMKNPYINENIFINSPQNNNNNIMNNKTNNDNNSIVNIDNNKVEVNCVDDQIRISDKIINFSPFSSIISNYNQNNYIDVHNNSNNNHNNSNIVEEIIKDNTKQEITNELFSLDPIDIDISDEESIDIEWPQPLTMMPYHSKTILATDILHLKASNNINKLNNNNNNDNNNNNNNISSGEAHIANSKHTKSPIQPKLSDNDLLYNEEVPKLIPNNKNIHNKKYIWERGSGETYYDIEDLSSVRFHSTTKNNTHNSSHSDNHSNNSNKISSNNNSNNNTNNTTTNNSSNNNSNNYNNSNNNNNKISSSNKIKNMNNEIIQYDETINNDINILNISDHSEVDSPRKPLDYTIHIQPSTTTSTTSNNNSNKYSTSTIKEASNITNGPYSFYNHIKNNPNHNNNQVGNIMKIKRAYDEIEKHNELVKQRKNSFDNNIVIPHPYFEIVKHNTLSPSHNNMMMKKNNKSNINNSNINSTDKLSPKNIDSHLDSLIQLGIYKNKNISPNNLLKTKKDWISSTNNNSPSRRERSNSLTERNNVVNINKTQDIIEDNISILNNNTNRNDNKSNDNNINTNNQIANIDQDNNSLINKSPQENKKLIRLLQDLKSELQKKDQEISSLKDFILNSI